MAVIPRFRMVAGYTVALIANYFQSRLIETGMSFSQETVFSHPSKVEALRRAKAKGFRTYLYYVATENPIVNVLRVSQRVKEGGHDVPREKIVERYERSLAQVPEALEVVSRAFFFDNSGNGMRFLAEYAEGQGMRLRPDLEEIPRWFRKYGLPHGGV